MHAVIHTTQCTDIPMTAPHNHGWNNSSHITNLPIILTWPKGCVPQYQTVWGGVGTIAYMSRQQGQPQWVVSQFVYYFCVVRMETKGKRV